MSEVHERIRELKTQAKNRRDLGRYERAAKLLEEAIAIAKKELEATNVAEWRATLASELADCYGLLGGVERRWALDPKSTPSERAEHLRRSVDAYDNGHRFEADRAFGLANTYNTLNRLLSRLLLDPGLLAAGGERSGREGSESVDVRRDLEVIAGNLQDELATRRRDDYWALADLALVNVLLGRQDAASAYAAFEAELRPDFAYQSALATVTPLAELNLPTSAQLRLARERLERRLKSLQAG